MLKKNIIRISIMLLAVIMLIEGSNLSYASSKIARGANEKWSSTTVKESDNQNLTVGLETYPWTLDPAVNAESNAVHIMNNMFEGLVREFNGHIELATASSYRVSEDGMTYTFVIREDAKWSDGKQVTANDFEYGWNRTVDPETNSEYAWLFDELNILSWKAVNSKTFQVDLTEPTPYFVQTMGFSTFFPLREDIVTSSYMNDWSINPTTSISNGPFKLVLTNENSVVLKPNTFYWDNNRVYLKEIKWIVYESLGKLLTAYENEDVDIIDDISFYEIPRLMATEPTLSISPMDGTYYYIFNDRVAGLDDVRVRKALSLAIDREKIVNWVTKSGQIATHSLIPSSFKDAQGNVFNQKTGTYDIATTAKIKEAQALLAEAGYPMGKGFPKIEIFYNTSDGHKAIATAIQKMWKENLGIEVNFVNEEWASFQNKRLEGNFQIVRAGWIGDFTDPITYLGLFTSDSFYNYSGWHNKQFDTLIESSKYSKGQERFDLLYKADKILSESYIVMPIYNYSDLQLVNDNIHGLEKTTRSVFYFGRTKIVEDNCN